MKVPPAAVVYERMATEDDNDDDGDKTGGGGGANGGQDNGGSSPSPTASQLAIQPKAAFAREKLAAAAPAIVPLDDVVQRFRRETSGQDGNHLEENSFEAFYKEVVAAAPLIGQSASRTRETVAIFRKFGREYTKACTMNDLDALYKWLSMSLLNVQLRPAQ